MGERVTGCSGTRRADVDRTVASTGGEDPPEGAAGGVTDALGATSFLVDTLGDQPLTGRVLPIATVTSLLSFSALGDLIAATPLPPPQVRMYRSGALDPGRYAGVSQDRTTLRYGSADPRNVRERLAEGATLVVEQMDRLVPAIGEMTEAMRCWLRCPVDTVAYATVGSAGGFGAHFDDNDVIAVHLDGAKRWRIWEPTRAYPLHRDVARPPRPVSEPAREITLEPGDVMYLPRGWWHEATTPGGAAVSLHLTMRVHRRTGVDWLAWLADQLRSSGALSADLPEFASDLERARHRQRLLEELVRSADEQDWSRFVQAEGVDAAG